MNGSILDWRIILSLPFITLSGMIISGQIYNSVFPGVVFFFFLGILSLITISFYISDSDLIPIIVSALLVSVGYRLYSMSIPASMVGDDPHANAIWIRSVIEYGDISQIGSGFYTDAPFHYATLVLYTIISGVSVESSIHIYAILIGVVLPLIVVSMTRSIGVEKVQFLALAALLAPITTEAIRRTYWPIAQTTASVYWWLFVLVLLWYVRNPTKRFYFLLMIFTGSIAYAHKLPLAIIVLTLSILLFLTRIDRFAWGNSKNQEVTKQILSVFGLAAIITASQWLYASQLLNQITFRIRTALASIVYASDPIGSRDSYQPTDAIPARPGLIGEFVTYPTQYGLYFERAHAIWLLLFSGIAFAYIYFSTREDEHRNSIQVLLAAATVCVSVILIGQVAVGAMNPTRPLLLIEPILITLIVVFLGFSIGEHWSDLSNISGKILYSFVILLVVTQLFAPSVAADYTNTPRYYLDEPELKGADMINNYSESTVYVDQEAQAFTRHGNFERISRLKTDPLYNANITPGEHSTVMYRNNVDVYLGKHDRWELTWDPENELAKEYGTIYNNGAVVTYNA